MMNREIKFRGMTPSGEWRYGLLCHDKEKDKDFEWFISNSVGKPYAYGIIKNSIGQFTGLKDKNGIEIYEGDILKLTDEYRGKGEHPSYVIFENSQWMLQGTMHYSHKDAITNYSLDRMEVIGNIHQNPELLNN